jgi:hypothetical protein
MEVTEEVGTMTTMAKEEVTTKEVLTPTVPETLTEEHHEAIKASWELPAYERQAPAATRSSKPLVVGIITGAVCLGVGFGAGYWAHTQMVQTAAPYVISRVAGPVDANGMNFGRRLAPVETTLPAGITMGGPVDANGATLGRRVAPFDSMEPTALSAAALTDANGSTFGRRIAPFDTMEPTARQAAALADANGLTFGQRLAPLESVAPVALPVARGLAFGRHGGRP